MKFHSPEYLFLIVALIALVVVYTMRLKKKKSIVLKHFSDANIKALDLINPKREKAAKFSFVFLILALFMLVIGLARPQYGFKQKNFMVDEHSVVFLVDVSKSMLARDIRPSRLSFLKQELLKTLDSIGKVKVGLVVFAGGVDVLAPMTEDLSAIKSYVKTLSPDHIYTQGTNIKDALREVEGLFERTTGVSEKGSKIIVLFSDGEDHQPDTIERVKVLNNKGYKIFAVGVGSEEGGSVPETEDSRTYVKNASGKAAFSKPNFEFLKEISKVGGGAFYYLTILEKLGPKLYEAFGKIEGSMVSQRKFVVKNELYQVFIVISLFLFVISFYFKRKSS